MGIFPKSPEKAIVKDRDIAKANVDRLAMKLNDAERAVIATKQAAQRAALNGDDGGLDAAEAAERAALHRHGTLGAAHAEAGKLLEHLESQIAEQLDKKTRVATNVSCVALADELVEAAAAYDGSTELLAEIAGRCLPVTSESNGLHIFTQSSRVEVAAAVPIIAGLLKEHGRACLNRLAPAAMPKVPEPPAKMPTPVAQPVAVAAESAPPVFRRVDRPTYQMKFVAKG